VRTRQLRESFPLVIVEKQLHIVEDGNLLTSAGIAAGLEPGPKSGGAFLRRGRGPGHGEAQGISLFGG